MDARSRRRGNSLRSLFVTIRPRILHVSTERIGLHFSIGLYAKVDEQYDDKGINEIFNEVLHAVLRHSEAFSSPYPYLSAYFFVFTTTIGLASGLMV